MTGGRGSLCAGSCPGSSARRSGRNAADREVCEWLASNKELQRKWDELERRLGAHDQAVASILSALRELTVPPVATKKRKIGFIQDDD